MNHIYNPIFTIARNKHPGNHFKPTGKASLATTKKNGNKGKAGPKKGTLVNFSPCRVAKYFQALRSDPNLGPVIGVICGRGAHGIPKIVGSSWFIYIGKIGIYIYLYIRNIRSKLMTFSFLKMYWFVGMICQGTSLQNNRPMPPDPDKRTESEPEWFCGFIDVLQKEAKKCWSRIDNEIPYFPWVF